jgi:glycogen synthase
MKILQLAETLVPERGYGLARYASELGRELAALGHEVQALTLSGNGVEPTSERLGVRIHDLGEPYPFFAYNDSLQSILLNVPLGRRILDLWDEAGPFDILHAFGWMCGPAAILAERVRQVPLVASLQAEWPGRDAAPLESWIAAMEGWVGERAAGIVFPTESAKGDFLNRISTAAEVRVIQAAVRTEDFNAPVDLPDFRGLFGASDDRIVLFAGHMSRLKPLQELIEAASLAAARRPDLRFVFAGDGPHRVQLEDLVRRSGIENRVRFTGPLHTIVLGALYRAVDLLVQPNTSASLGLSALEAVASGTPVLTISAADDPLPRGAHRIRNPSALADAIVRHAASKHEKHRPAAVAWTWKDAAAALVALYGRVTDSRLVGAADWAAQ